MKTTDIIKNLSKMNASELRMICREMNCKVGSKTQMIARLVAPLLKGKYKFKMENTPDEILGHEILTHKKLMELLEVRTVNRRFKNSADDVLRSQYNKVYSERSPDNMDIVILRLKQALLPPFRTGKSKYHYKEFDNEWGNPMYLKYPLWADAAYTDAEKTAFKEKLKKKDNEDWYGWPSVLEFLFLKNNRDDDYLETWSEAAYERKDIPGHEYKSGGNTGWDDLANHINNPNSDIYKLMEEYIPEELYELGNIFKELEKNNSDFSFQRLFDLIGVTSSTVSSIARRHPDHPDEGIGGVAYGPGSTRQDGQDIKQFMDYFFFGIEGDWKAYQLQFRCVENTIKTLDHYKVGDYFIFYNFIYSSRQYHNISMVGYDTDTNQKVVIEGNEAGEPYPPRWLVDQFNRIGLDFSFPQEEIMESGRY